ncbi:MAG: hypothetical protein R2568_06060 [Candidatus Scalindua sp.]|jgi:hypothetical protein|nr:hypothetical protein [Candidatus Scalindua sp.]MDV5166296.1 hypothetical protein [Candidatus Scalindua sp.]
MPKINFRRQQNLKSFKRLSGNMLRVLVSKIMKLFVDLFTCACENIAERKWCMAICFRGNRGVVDK